MMVLPTPEQVLPHRDNMLLLDRITAFDDALCAAEYAPRSDAWYADAAGDMPAWIGVELMAQAVAAQVGMEKRSRGLPPKLGMLLGTRSYKSVVSSFRAGAALSINARLQFRDESGLAAYDCEIRRAGEVQEILASAILKVFEPDDFQAFVKGIVE